MNQTTDSMMLKKTEAYPFDYFFQISLSLLGVIHTLNVPLMAEESQRPYLIENTNRVIFARVGTIEEELVDITCNMAAQNRRKLLFFVFFLLFVAIL